MGNRVAKGITEEAKREEIAKVEERKREAMEKKIEDSFQSKVEMSQLFEAISKELSKADPKLPIVSSIGSQSLGKSFLLNFLFGSNFKTKKSVNDGKCTESLNLIQLENMTLLDLEGIGSDVHLVQRDHSNLAFSLFFSKVILFHVEQKNLIDNQHFFNSFSYSYWLAMRKLKSIAKAKVNDSRREIPKIILLIREPDSQFKTIDEITQEISEISERFVKIINDRIEIYNFEASKLIEHDPDKACKNEAVKLLPTEDEFRFKIEFAYPFNWDKNKKTYLELVSRGGDWLELDRQDFLLKLTPYLPNQDFIVHGNNHIKYFNPTPEYIDYFQRLLECKQLLKGYIQSKTILEQFLFKFYLGIEIDPSFTCISFEEYQSVADSLPQFIGSLNQEVDKLQSKANKDSAINEAMYRANHKKSMDEILDKIRSSTTRKRIMETLIKNTAATYDIYVGVPIENPSCKDLSSCQNIEPKMILDNSFDIIKLYPENITLFLIETIVNFQDESALIENEFIKLAKIQQTFNCLSYSPEFLEFYNQHIKKASETNFFFVVYSCLNDKIGKVFESELSCQEHCTFEKTREKLSKFNFNKMEINLKKLINQLKLEISEEQLLDFLIKLQSYFETFSICMVVRIREIYRNPNPASSIIYNFEKIHVILRKNINIKLVAGYLAIIGGSTLKLTSIFAVIHSGIIIGTWSTLAAELGGIGPLIGAVGAMGFIYSGAIVGGVSLAKWGNKQYQIYNGTRFTDEFKVGRDFEFGLKIEFIKNSDLKMRNCTLAKEFPFTKQTVEAYSCEMLFELSTDTFVSATILSTYVFSTAPTQSFNFKPIIGRDLDMEISKFLSR